MLPELSHFVPLLHTVTTPDLERLLSDRNLASTAHLLEPFAASVKNVSVRSPNYEPRTLSSFPVKLVERDLPPGWDATLVSASETARDRARSGSMRRDRSFDPAQQPNVARHASPVPPAPPTSQAQRDELFLDSLSSEVAANVEYWVADPNLPTLSVRPVVSRKQLYDVEGNPVPSTNDDRIDEGWEGKSVDELTPWYAALRDEVFERREMVEWETWGWPVGCVLALSTSHPDPLNALSLLWDLTSPASLYAPTFPLPHTPPSSTRQDWANPDLLRYVLLVHDMSSSSAEPGADPQQGWNDAKRLEETVKKTYGVHTALVPLFGPGDAPAKETLDSLFGKRSRLGHDLARSRQQPHVGLGVVGYDVSPSSSALTPSGSRTNLEPVVSSQDIEALGRFMRESVVQSVIPWIERAVVVGNEQFTASKKSIGGRLFSVGRKYFGGGSSSGGGSSNATSRSGSPVAGSSTNGYNASRGFYPYQAQESQSRRLADLAFVLGDYKLAGGIYDQCTKDYRGDKAWKHYSAAMRMAGLCQILSLPPAAALPTAPSPDSYLVSSILTNPSLTALPAPLDLDLIRSTMLYHHLYLARRDVRFSPVALVRAAGDADELVSAMLIEQSALSQLRIRNDGTAGSGRKRKFAMEMVMAGVRYEKCGLKSLSRRCLSQASSLYTLPLPSPLEPIVPSSCTPRQTTFSSIRSHLHHSLGRQAYNVGDSIDALFHFVQLLVPTPSSAVPTGQGDEGELGQGGGAGGAEPSDDWLDDFSLAWESLGQGDQVRAEELAQAGRVELPVRLFDVENVKVSRGIGLGRSERGRRVDDGTGDDARWADLERRLVDHGDWSGATTAAGPSHSRGKQAARLVASLQGGQALVGETFWIELPITNPLEAFLSIGNLRVRVERPGSDADGQGQGETDLGLAMEDSIEDVVELAPLETRTILVPLRGTQIGTYAFPSISYRFHNLLPVTETLATAVRASTSPRTDTSKAAVNPQPSVPTVTLRPPIPILSVSTAALPRRLFHGETRRVSVKLKNEGRVALSNLQAVSSSPEIAVLAEKAASESNPEPASSPRSFRTSNAISETEPARLTGVGQTIEPGGELDVEVDVRGDEVGSRTLDWLFAYQSTDASSEIFSARASHAVEVLPSLDFCWGARPGARGEHPFSVSIEAYNLGVPSSDLLITSVSLVSPLWRLSPLPGVSFEDLTSSPIDWHQTSNLVFSLDHVEAGIAQVDQVGEWSVRQVKGLLEGRKPDGTTGLAPVTLYDSRLGQIPSTPPTSTDPTILRSYLKSRLSALVQQFPTVPPPILRTLFPLFAPTGGLILVHFASSSLDLAGHHLLPLESVGATRNRLERVLADAGLKAGGLYEESQRERSALIKSLRACELGRDEDPAVVFVEVSGVEEHAFENGPLSLPVTFVIRNVSPTVPFDYALTLGTSSDSAMVYSGLLTRRGSIAPLSTARVSTRAFIVRQGVYDVGGWQLRTVAAGDGPGSKSMQRGAKRESVIRSHFRDSQEQR
ncbi:hypothetical protein JCM10212_004833 [Sporobolomyces blumeae]